MCNADDLMAMHCTHLLDALGTNCCAPALRIGGLIRVSILILLNLNLNMRREGRASRLGDTVRSSMRLACVCAARSGSSSARNSMAEMARLVSTSCAADRPSPSRTHSRDFRGWGFSQARGSAAWTRMFQAQH